MLLLLTDQASYMLTTGQGLRTLYPSLIHLTCLAHAMHRVAEEVRAGREYCRSQGGARASRFLEANVKSLIFTIGAPQSAPRF